MRILEKFHIKGRGHVFSVSPGDKDIDTQDARVRRLSDGAEYVVRGFERFCMYSNRRMLEVREQKVGFAILVGNACALEPGDEVEFIT